MRLQHGDFFAHLSVAAPAVPREGIAVDEELPDSFVCKVVEYFRRFEFLSSSIPLLERICVRDLVVATNLSVLDQRIQYPGSSCTWDRRCGYF